MMSTITGGKGTQKLTKIDSYLGGGEMGAPKIWHHFP